MLAYTRACGRKPCSATSGKLKRNHIRAPPPGGFLISICLQVLWRQSLRTIAQDSAPAHHAPQRDVPCAHATQDHAYLVRPRSDDCDETPVLNLLHCT